MSAPTTPPDPHRKVTPGGFHVDSPFARQYVPPETPEKPSVPKPQPVAADPHDLEEAYHRLEEIINAVQSAKVGKSHIGAKVVTASGEFLDEELERVRDLIYRNLR